MPSLVFTALCLVLAACAPAVPVAVSAPPPLTQEDRLVAQSDKLDMRQGEEVEKAGWTLSETANPDIWTIQLDKGERREVCLASGARSLCRTVGVGDRFDFIVSYNGKEYPTRIAGEYVPPMARFTPAYQAANRGKTRLEIPEVYELVNVAIALTDKAQTNDDMVVKSTPYYAAMMAHFAPLRDHPFVLALDAQIKARFLNYFDLKMNGYAFEYGANGKIVRSAVYDRTGFAGSTTNHLLPYLSQMQDFSDKSGFRAFYDSQRPLYQSQIDFYRNEVGVPPMVEWLQLNFPDVKPYDTTNVIFSPLVGGSQSLTWMESNGFRELQPHVNFIYEQAIDKELSRKAAATRRGMIVFTELNHGFINPTASNYGERISRALLDRTPWSKPNSPSTSYGSPESLFNEMMNWALVSLYVVDRVPDPVERERLVALVSSVGDRRGFLQFPAFNRFLVNLYTNRPAGTPVAALYPQIVSWFETRGRDAQTPG